MIKFTHHLGMKVFACFLVIIMGMVTLFSGAAVIMSGESGFYGNQPLSYAETPWCQSTTYTYAENVMDWLNSNQSLEDIKERFGADKTNFRFELLSSDNEPILTNFDETEDSVSFVGEYHFSLYYDYGTLVQDQAAEGSASFRVAAEESYDSAVSYSEPVWAVMRCYVSDPLTVSDHYWISYRIYEITYDLHNPLILILLCSMLVLAASLVYLLCAAGHQEGTNAIVPNLQDRIPLDLYLGIVALLLSLSFSVGYHSNILYSAYDILFCTAVILFLGILTLATLMTCATRLKMGKWWKNTITYQVCRICWKFTAAIFTTFLDIIAALPMVWKVAVTWLIISLFYLTGTGNAFLLNIVLLFVFCSIASQLQKLKKAGEHLAKGNLDYKVDTKKMLRSFRRHGENLNSISKGFSIALNQKMKSERMKTELITNVSHDIKTPLTSIINYVDLLKKEGLEGQAAEYIEVLDRQSRRLKKLTEDLVEASKASTGNLTVKLAPTDMGELVAQSVAEYEEKLAAAQLEAIISGPDSPIFAMVDGGLTWRVLSNLLSNACKYSQTGTRVYIDVRQMQEHVVVSMKNISRDPLNIPADELMERFVRGDSSRSTEGSGLGLNIARSLVELQKGKFSLEIDGDMFKALVKFPLTDPPAPPAEEPSEAAETSPTA